MGLSICLILIYLLKRHPHLFQSEMLSTSRLPGQPSLSEDTKIHFKVIQEEAFSDIQTVPYTHTHTHTHTHSFLLFLSPATPGTSSSVQTLPRIYSLRILHPIILQFISIYICIVKCLVLFLWPRHTVHRTWISWPGTEPRPPALGVWSLDHWTTRECAHHLFPEVRDYVEIISTSQISKNGA